MLNKVKYKIGYSVKYIENFDVLVNIPTFSVNNQAVTYSDTVMKTLCTIIGYKGDNLILKSIWDDELTVSSDTVELTTECARDYIINNLLNNEKVRGKY